MLATKTKSNKFKGSRVLYPVIIDGSGNTIKDLAIKTIRLPKGVMPVGSYEVSSINYFKSIDSLRKAFSSKLGRDMTKEFTPLVITIKTEVGYIRLYTKGSVLLQYLADTLGVEMPYKVTSEGREYQDWSRFLSSPTGDSTVEEFLIDTLASLEEEFNSWIVRVNVEDVPSTRQDWIKYSPIYKDEECREKFSPEELKEVLMKK